MNRLVRFLARALEPREREVVLGDIAESATSPLRGAFEIAGLVVRRQVLIWKHWQPWMALATIGGVSGFCLSRLMSGLSLSLFEQLSAWRRYGVHYDTGVRSFGAEVLNMACLAAMIWCWAAVNGSLLRRFSGRASWLTGILFYFAVVDSGLIWAVLSGAAVYRGGPLWLGLIWPFSGNPESIMLRALLFAVPMVLGARGRFPNIIWPALVCTLFAGVTGWRSAHALEIFSHGEFPAPSGFSILGPYALLSWPVLLLVRRDQLKSEL